MNLQDCLICPLCSSKTSEIFYKIKNNTYRKCLQCNGIFLDIRNLPDANTEMHRYMQHNNDVNDIRYQKFVSPIVNAVLNSFSPDSIGLDFGAGTGPVITKMLREKNYSIEVYDPFFHNNTHLLNNKYDYIACCEVVEHFHNPKKEFQLLKNLLNPRGSIFIMTSLYNNEIDFNKWYYKDDPTHVFFYQKETVEYIKKMFDFDSIDIIDSLIVFKIK